MKVLLTGIEPLKDCVSERDQFYFEQHTENITNAFKLNFGKLFWRDEVYKQYYDHNSLDNTKHLTRITTDC